MTLYILNLMDEQIITKNNIEREIFSFPTGEQHIKLNHSGFEENDDVVVYARVLNGNDLMTLLLATDALKRQFVTRIHLVMAYVPFARQDRVMVSGEPLSIGVLTSVINAQNYKSVSILDPHSDVTPALLNNVIVYDNSELVIRSLQSCNVKKALLIAPDAGAQKKIFKLVQKLQELTDYTFDISLCGKHRDVSNGKITGVFCDREDYQGEDVFIVDDICDGGWTFQILAEELKKRNVGKVNLIVTHGIFTRGLEPLSAIDCIFTTTSVHSNSKPEWEAPDLPNGVLFDLDHVMVVTSLV